MTKVLIALIRLYQRTLSPDHGWFRTFYRAGYCRFIPSCSDYYCDALSKYGFWRGNSKGIQRIFRCNPFSTGGHDEA